MGLTTGLRRASVAVVTVVTVAGRRTGIDRAEHGHAALVTSVPAGRRARGLEAGNERLPHVYLAEFRLADQVRLRARVAGLALQVEPLSRVI